MSGTVSGYYERSFPLKNHLLNFTIHQIVILLDFYFREHLKITFLSVSNKNFAKMTSERMLPAMDVHQVNENHEKQYWNSRHRSVFV